MAECLFVAERFEGFGGGREAGGEEGANFVEEAAAPHCLATVIEMCVERFAGRVEGEDEGVVTG